MKKIIVLLCLLLLAGIYTFGQEFGSIRGAVVDKEGTPLPGVTITLTGSKTAPRTAITSEKGNFRFLNLPVAGDYGVKFELAGFKSVSREKQVISFGRDVAMNITMEQAAIAETITVIGQTPVIDTKRTQVGVNITSDMIMSLPTARNPWVMMALVPGMLVDREDIGGNEGGQQSAYFGHGSSGADNTWNIDGANITDNSALGAAPAYVNIASYEELQINYGNNDVRAQTGGVQLNLVTKRGGNAYSGTFYLDVENQSWELENVPDSLKKIGYMNPGVNRVYLYGVNFGGPIIKDKAWFYGSWGIQDIEKRTIVGTTDKTWLASGYGQLNFQLTPNTRVSGFLEYDDKNKWNRTAWSDAEQAPETKWNQTGPGYLWKGEVEQQFGNLLLNVKGIYTNGGFNLQPVGGKRTADGSGKYMWISYDPSFYVTGNIDDYGTDRNQLNLNFNGTYFAEGILGGDHEIKFGADYVTSTVTSFDYYEGNLIISDYGGGWVEAEVKRDVIINFWFARYSAFIQDTVTFGKLAVTLGLRYDSEQSMIKNENVPASPWLPQYLPALKVDKIDPGIKWSVFSPRVNFSYDLRGNGKDVIKLSLARYGSQSGFEFAGFTSAIGWNGIGLLWEDLNHDARVTANELFGYDGDTGMLVNPNDYNYWLYFWGMDPSKPTNVRSSNKYDSNYNSPLLDEVSLSYEKELLSDFAARIELFYKTRHNFAWDKGIFSDGTLDSQANWYKGGTNATINADYWLRYKRPVASYRTNAPNAFQRYMAAQIVVKKRLSNGWMLDGSFTYSDWSYHYEGDYFDPTNVKYYDGGVVAPGSGGSGLSGIYVNSRWMFKLAGLYQLPGGINASAVFVAREGYVIPTYVIQNRAGIGNTNLYGHAGGGGSFGDTRLPTMYVLNFRIEKVFNVSGSSRVTIAADGFNILNVATSMKKAGRIGASDYMQDKTIVNPGLFRFGIRFDF